ncbi:hypothetical protein, partial [Burkholderia anthina]|uniref:hypothetical protein n=1 Tax=Burkholderia anthina TaxID=179879 RepID=UPI003C7E5426
MVEQLQVAEDGIERRADLVAHRGQEGGLRGVRLVGGELGVTKLVLQRLAGRHVDEGRDQYVLAQVAA